MPALTPLAEIDISRLHRRTIRDRGRIVALLRRAKELKVPLLNGVNRRNQSRIARVIDVGEQTVELRTREIDSSAGPQLYLNMEIEGVRYFFAASARAKLGPRQLTILMPDSIFEVERRDSHRVPHESDSSVPSAIDLLTSDRERIRAHVVDYSYDGLAVRLRQQHASRVDDQFEVHFLDGDRAGETAFASVRHRSEEGAWQRFGLSVSKVRQTPLLPVERRDRILSRGAGAYMWNRISVLRSAARAQSSRLLGIGKEQQETETIRVVEYPNQKGKPIRAIVDAVGSTRNAPAIVIPPAWGRTKETLAPLALSLTSTFDRARERVAVIRFDGTNRRGESYIEPRHRQPGDEYLGFTFSQAVEDIHATLRFLNDHPDFQPSRVILITFSLSAVEGRRAIATDPLNIIAGWISVVGMVDLQSGLRSVSGGVDYAYGLRRGVRFGRHELVGVTADMDYTGLDALDHEMVLFEDAKRDMALLEVPVVWVHGRHDAWIDRERVRELLSSGSSSNRRLLEVPTGHQLRNSREALETFQLISEESARLLIGREVQAPVPDIASVQRRVATERQRRPKVVPDLREFWADYLLGRDRRIGIELMTATSPYRALMSEQVSMLALRGGERVLDLGTGTGDFSLGVGKVLRNVDVISIDLVGAALRRARSRLAAAGMEERIRPWCVNADLSGERSIPVADRSIDAAIASLLISYLPDPAELLRDLRRVVRPGGRIVVSCLKRDADISQIYVDGVEEILSRDARKLFDVSDASFERLQRQFLNDAARILELEEAGVFRFWDGGELGGLIRRAGFSGVSVHREFGDPPQAVIVRATRP